MARPKKDAAEKRDKRLTVYLTEEERDTLYATAERENRAVTQVVITAVKDWIHRLTEPSTAPCTDRIQRRDGLESSFLILETAQRLFAKYGVAEVSMHQIAKAAGVGQGTLYRRYANKGELCMELLKESAEKVMQEMEQQIADIHGHANQAIEVLDSVIERAIDFIDEKEDLLASVNQAQLIGDNEFYQKLHHIFCQLLKMAELEPRDMDIPLAADILLSTISPSFYLFERDMRKYSKTQFVEGIRDMYLNKLQSRITE